MIIIVLYLNHISINSINGKWVASPELLYCSVFYHTVPNFTWFRCTAGYWKPIVHAFTTCKIQYLIYQF